MDTVVVGIVTTAVHGFSGSFLDAEDVVFVVIGSIEVGSVELSIVENYKNGVLIVKFAQQNDPALRS